MISKLTGGLAGSILGLAILAPSAAFAGGPVQVDSQDPDPCVADFSLGTCDRPGGLVARGQKALLLTFDGGDVVQHLSTDAGATWSGAMKLGDNATFPQAIAQDGEAIAYVYRGGASGTKIRTGWEWGVMELSSTSTGFDAPRQVTTHVAADVEKGVFAWAAAGYDEVSQGRKTNAIRIRRDYDGIGNEPIVKTIAWNGVGCLPRGTDPSLAVADGGRVIVAYWKTCTNLVVQRIDFLSGKVSAPTTISTGQHSLGMSIDAQGKTVVIAYTAGGKVLTRRSTDAGKTWGPAKQAGSGATSVRIAYLDGAWHLLTGGTTSVRYRSSANGATWSAGQTVDSLADARTYAVGLAFGGGKLLQAYSIRQSQTSYGLFVYPR